MKKTRFLAALLCVMMVLTMIPMMASAAVSDSLYDQIGGLMGRNSSRAVNDATWLSMNFDFTDNFSQTDSITMPEGASYDNTNGLNMPKETYSTWTYFPSTLTSQGWSPLVFGAYYLRFKLDEAGKLEAQACAYYNNARSFIIMSPTGVTVFTSSDNATIGSGMASVTNLVDYAPGTDWNDMVVVANGGSGNSANGYSVYMKKDVDTEFTKVASTGSYRSNGGWKSTGLTLSGNDSYVSDAVMLEGSDTALVTDPEEGGEEEQVIPNPGITQDLLNATGAVLGGKYGKPAVGSSDWATTNLVFDASFDTTQDGITSPEGVTYNENGLNFPESSVTWKYRPTCKHNGWSPLCISNNYTFGFRLKEGGNLINQAPKVWNGARVFIDFTNNGVTVYNGGETDGAGQAVTENLVDYKPGTDWNDVMVVADATGGYDVYMKKASDKEFTHVASAPTYRKGSAWNSTGFQLDGAKAYVNYAVSYVPVLEGARFDSIEEIAGGPVVSTYNFTMDKSFNNNYSLAEGTSTVGITHNGEYTADGWKGANWKFLPTSAWAPLTSGGEDTMIYFKAKTATVFNVQGRAATSGRIYFDIKANERSYSNAPTKTYHSDSLPGTDWAEYLITRYNEGAGYALYMKSETGTAGKWEQMITTSDHNASGGSGIAFYSGSADTYFKDVKILSTTKAVADAATKPATATTLYYEDDFADAPDYDNLSCIGATYDGDLVLTETTEVAAEAVLGNGEIPKGGYAEYRIKTGETNPTIHFYDGERAMSIFTRVNYGALYTEGTALLYAADAGDSYRTWRVVRHEDGNYSAYCKVDGETNWYAAQVNVVGKAVGNTPQVKLVGTLGYDGEAGVTELDYLKIYGPAPTDTLTLTDGIGTAALTGNTLLHTTPRALVKQGDAAKTVVFAEYADEILVNVKVEEVVAGSEVVSVPYAMKNRANTVKVFLWDGFTKQASLQDVIQLNVQ